MAKENLNQEAKWLQYFKGISDVCPWSLESYTNGRIRFVEYDGVPESILAAEKYWDNRYDAVVWTGVIDDVDNLDNFVYYYLDDSKTHEYFWSHPEHTKGRNKQAPEPIIIQQNRTVLNKARNSIK